MKLRKEIPVLHVYFVWQPLANSSKVKDKIITNIKTTVWAITFEPEVIETVTFFISANNEDIGQKL